MWCLQMAVSLVMWIFDRQHGMPKTATSFCLPALPKTSATSSACQLKKSATTWTPNEAATCLISTRMLAIPWLTMMALQRRLLNNAKVAGLNAAQSMARTARWICMVHQQTNLGYRTIMYHHWHPFSCRSFASAAELLLTSPFQLRKVGLHDHVARTIKPT